MLTQNLRFLIIDDSPYKFNIAKMRLTLYFKDKPVTFTLKCAQDEAESARLLKDELFDCIIIDYQMPRSTGPQILEPFCKSLTKSRVYVIGFSQYYFEPWAATPEVGALYQDFLDVGDHKEQFFNCFDKLMNTLMNVTAAKPQTLILSQQSPSSVHQEQDRRKVCSGLSTSR